ncbi:hypothetical protein Q0Q56_14140, partial [Staphylococcus aureus]|nr:hypothetical protein [Staphylococcus aureus]
ASATTSFFGSSLGASALTSSLAGAAPSGFAAVVSINTTTCPTCTVSPSSAFNVMIPLASAGNSRVALS